MKKNERKNTKNYINNLMKKYSITEEEAIKKVNEIKKFDSRSLENNIRIYGEELGKLKYNEKEKRREEKKKITKEKKDIERKYSRNDLEGFNFRYGDEGYKKWLEYKDELKKKRKNPHCVNDVMLKYKITKEEAEKIIADLKIKIGHSLKNLILLYGEEEGKARYEKIKESRSKRINNYDFKQVIKKYNISEAEAKNRVDELKKKTRIDKDFFIKKYGDVNGEIKYKEFQEKSKHTKDKFIKKYGQEEGEIKWNIYCSSKDCSSPEYFIKKYGKKEGKEKFKERCETTKITFEKFLKKYGDEEIAHQKYKEYVYKKTSHLSELKYGKASKESLIFFEPIFKYCDTNKIYYFVGHEKNDEFYIWDRKTTRKYFYDFVIKNLNIIFEYDGFVHPHKIFSDPKTWRCPLRGISYDEALKEDTYKEEVAKKEGFSIYRIHYLDIKNNKKELQEGLIRIIEERFKNEDKKNN